MNNELYRVLSKEEAGEFKQWARENYTTGDPVKELWHPVSRAECEKMNAEITTDV